MRRLIFLLVILLWLTVPGEIPMLQADIVIYGGGLAGCAAAKSAASSAAGQHVLLIVPEPVEELGGLATSGGQNFADIRYWRGKPVTEGSFARWLEEAGQFYSVHNMAEIIRRDLSRYPNIKILYGYDINSLRLKEKGLQDEKKDHQAGKRDLEKVFLRSLIREEKSGFVQWAGRSILTTGRVFVDASDDGRLASFSGAALSIGRQDWPGEYLQPEERGEDWAYQQAATLMFKVRGVITPETPGEAGEWVFTRDTKGSWGLAGGKKTWAENPAVRAFTEKYQTQGFAIKPINAAQDGKDSGEWWVNTLLVFNVDARARERDRGSANFPQYLKPEALSVDEAWAKARALLAEPDFIRTLREFKVNVNGRECGFAQTDLVTDGQGRPMVGQVMYLRESMHGQLQEISGHTSGNSAGSENSNYALTTIEAQQAGTGPDNGADRGNYSDRIGLGYYMMDINAFTARDLKADGAYQWPVTRFVRPDWSQAGGEPQNPVYLPYQMLTTPNATNLLVPGYATGCSSFAWAELRVLPNLAVLGDAAGTAAALALESGIAPRDFSRQEISELQERLKKMGARLEK